MIGVRSDNRHQEVFASESEVWIGLKITMGMDGTGVSVHTGEGGTGFAPAAGDATASLASGLGLAA